MSYLVQLCVTFSILLSVESAFTQEYARRYFKTPVTARYATSKKVKPNNYRIQLMPRGDSLAVVAFGFQRLQTSIRKLRFPELNVKTTRHRIKALVEYSLDSVYQFLTLIKQDLSYSLPTSMDYKKAKQRFLDGAKASPYFTNQWIKISIVSNVENKNVTVKTRGLFKTHHIYAYDYLPGAIAHELPALDAWHCEPANIQLLKLRKLQGYGPKKLKYTNYHETQRQILRPSFDVYFLHNEIKPDQPGLEKIISYLEQNNYVILNAVLQGGCSIEGDSMRNMFLQMERANVLQRALHKYSDELIRKDTVTLTNPMVQFRELIRTTELQYLDTLGDKQLRNLVNANNNIRAALESVFVLQRKASLKLVVAKRLAKSEQFEKFKYDFRKIISRLGGDNPAKADAESKIMGMIEKLLIYYEEGYVSKTEIDDLFNETDHPDYIRVLLTYHFLKQYQDQSWPKHVAKSWAAYWDHYDVFGYMKQAQLSLIFLCEFQPENQKKYLSMLVDLQSYTYEFVETGLLPPNNLCEIPYPEKREFIGLILNQYAYLYEVVSKSENPDHFVNCVPPGSKKRIHDRDSIVNTDEFLKELEGLYANRNESYTLVGQSLYKKKTFDESQKGAYYFLLKQYYVHKNTDILGQVTTADDNSSSFNVFNLWHFLATTIDAWDPERNFFYDKEVQLNEMEQLVSIMKKSDRLLCKPQINSLYLQYHLKMLHYLERFQEPGNPAHTKFADTSLKFIADYYKSRKVNVNSKLAVYVLKQLNLLNTLPGNRPGAWYGYDLLNSIAQSRILNEEELKLYAHYLRLFNPSLKKVPITYDQQALLKLAGEAYK